MSDGARRTVRTVFQNVLGLAAAMPLIVDAARLSDTVPGVAVALAVSGAVTRVMALPAVDGLLPSWLRSVSRG
jgi:hypothetical protein